MKGFVFKFLIFFSAVMISCEERQSGCLNPFSTNYDVDADNPCDDCCERQKLTINFRINFDELNFQKDSAYLDANMDSIFVTKLELVLSDFELLRADKEIITSLNRLVNDNLDIPNDLIFVNSVAKNATAIQYEYEGDVDSLNFKIGMPDDLLDGTEDFDNSNFETIKDSLYNETGNYYASLKMEYLDVDSLCYKVDLEQLQMPSIYFELDTTLVRGESISLTLNMDLAKIWSDVSLLEDTQDDIKQNFKNNFVQSISLN